VLLGECIVSVDRQLIVGEGKVLHGQCILGVDRQLIGGKAKFCMASYCEFG
jgi:hypothetical protein